MHIEARQVRSLLADARRLTVEEQLGVIRVLSWLDLDRAGWGALEAAAFRVSAEMQASPSWQALARRVWDDVRSAIASPGARPASGAEVRYTVELLTELEHGQLAHMAHVHDRITLTRHPARIVAALQQAIGQADVWGEPPTHFRVDPEPHIPQDPAVASVPDGPRLHFVLRGEQVAGNTMVAGSYAELVFRHDVVPAHALAQVADPAADAARRADVLLIVAARGAIRIVGRPFGTARFNAGQLDTDLVFGVQADAGAPAGTASSLHVDFLGQGKSVHEVELVVNVVAAGQLRSSSVLVAEGGTP